MSPSLVEAAARAMREWGVPGTDGGLTILAEEVLVAVGDALRLEGAQAERKRIVAVVRDFPLNICGDGSPMPRDQAVQVEDFRAAVLRALGGVHPEASDG